MEPNSIPLQSHLVLQKDGCIEVWNLWVDRFANHLAFGRMHEGAHLYAFVSYPLLKSSLYLAYLERKLGGLGAQNLHDLYSTSQRIVVCLFMGKSYHHLVHRRNLRRNLHGLLLRLYRGKTF